MISKRLKFMHILTVLMLFFYSLRCGATDTKSFKSFNLKELGLDEIYDCTVDAKKHNIYIACKKGVLLSRDLGATWHVSTDVFSCGEVIDMDISGNYLWIVSTKGVFRVNANKIEQVFLKRGLKGIEVSETSCCGPIFLIWTQNILYSVQDESFENVQIINRLDNIKESFITDKGILCVTSNAMYYSEFENNIWDKDTVSSKYTVVSEDEITMPEEETNDHPRSIKAVDYNSDGVLSVAIGNKILIKDIIRERSRDIRDISFIFPGSGTNYILNTKTDLFTATENEVFVFDEKINTWDMLFKPPSDERIKKLLSISDNNGDIYLLTVTDQDVYCSKIKDKKREKTGTLGEKGAFSPLPDIREVHSMVIDFAEVSPDKIKKWREKVKMKAMMPRVSVGFSESIDENIEIYKSATRSYVVNGPMEKGVDWNIDLSWDLSDLIWNEAQTSIDVRSKLMVQLREDLLQEVTRIYFERKRLILESEKELKAKGDVDIQKKLRIEELTAYIDGMTGGAFSRALGHDNINR